MSSSFKRSVQIIGDSFARCRISSEYAFPMPAKRRGSASDRFTVWFSTRSRARKPSSEAVRGSSPPGS